MCTNLLLHVLVLVSTPLGQVNTFPTARGVRFKALKYHAFQLIAGVVANYLTKYVCLYTPVLFCLIRDEHTLSPLQSQVKRLFDLV
jgi:hypothetical protein